MMLVNWVKVNGLFDFVDGVFFGHIALTVISYRK